MTNLRVSTGFQTDNTLLGILRRENPNIIDHWDGKSYKNTKSSSGIFDIVRLDDTRPNTVQHWTDFTYDAIHLAYGDVLDKPISAFRGQIPELKEYQAVDNPPKTPTIIATENDVDTLGIVWSCNIVRGPIKAAAAILRPRMSNAKTWSATLAPKKVAWAHPDAKKSGVTLSPDWLIMDHSVLMKYPEDKANQPAKPLVYALGDSKLKQKWKSSWLSLPDDQLEKVLMDSALRADKPVRRTITEERRRPLDQIVTYCRYALTRYAYLVTQSELVVMRVRRIKTSDKNNHHAAIEYASIPWSAKGKDGLTVHLAIWALACMGMNDAHRPMEEQDHTPLDKMARLTLWRRNTKNGYYENVISKRKIANEDWKPEWEKFVQLQEDPGNSHTEDFDTGSRPSTAGSGAGDSSGSVANLSKGMKAVKLGSTVASGAATASSSKPATAFKECKISGKGPFPVREKDKRYYAQIDQKWVAIETDGKSHYTVKHNSKILPVEMLK